MNKKELEWTRAAIVWLFMLILFMLLFVELSCKSLKLEHTEKTNIEYAKHGTKVRN